MLAVAAAVMSAPTGLAEWMPAAVEALCVLDSEDPVVRTTITKTVGDFRKSHQVPLRPPPPHSQLPGLPMLALLMLQSLPHLSSRAALTLAQKRGADSEACDGSRTCGRR